MASTSKTFPSAATQDAGGAVSWNTPLNAISDNATNTTVLNGMTYGEIGAKLVVAGTATGNLITVAQDTSITIRQYGASGNLWGLTGLTPAIVNASGFGLSYQVSGAAGTSNRLIANTFGFAIPSGATINGIIGEIERGAFGGTPTTTYVDYMALTVYYTDAAGDTTAPSVSISSPTTGTTYATSASTINISGTATDAIGVSNVNWSLGATTGTCTITSGTSVSWSVSGLTLASGSNTFTVNALDAANNTGSDTLTITYTPPADTENPVINITFPTTGSTYTKTTSGGIIVSGTCSDNIGVTSITYTTMHTSGYCTGTSTWVSPLISVAGLGYDITFTAYDLAGNAGFDTLEVDMTYVDSNRPTVSILYPSTDSVWLNPTSGTVFVSGTASDDVNLDFVTWKHTRVDGVAVTSGICTGTTSWRTPARQLGYGDNALQINAYDLAGNESYAAEITIVSNYEAPVTNDLPVIELSGYDKSVSGFVSISGTCADNDGISSIIWMQGSSSGNCTGTTEWYVNSLPIVAGDNTIIVRATDVLGNYTDATIVINWDVFVLTAEVLASGYWNPDTDGRYIRPVKDFEGYRPKSPGFGYRSRGLYVPKTMSGAVLRHITDRLHLHNSEYSDRWNITGSEDIITVDISTNGNWVGWDTGSATGECNQNSDGTWTCIIPPGTGDTGIIIIPPAVTGVGVVIVDPPVDPPGGGGVIIVDPPIVPPTGGVIIITPPGTGGVVTGSPSGYTSGGVSGFACFDVPGAYFFTSGAINSIAGITNGCQFFGTSSGGGPPVYDYMSDSSNLTGMHVEEIIAGNGSRLLFKWSSFGDTTSGWMVAPGTTIVLTFVTVLHEPVEDHTSILLWKFNSLAEAQLYYDYLATDDTPNPDYPPEYPDIYYPEVATSGAASGSAYGHVDRPLKDVHYVNGFTNYDTIFSFNNDMKKNELFKKKDAPDLVVVNVIVWEDADHVTRRRSVMKGTDFNSISDAIINGGDDITALAGSILVINVYVSAAEYDLYWDNRRY